MRIYGHGKIGRNVSVSHCHGQRLNSSIDPPDFEDFSFSVFGCYTEQRATRFARRVFGDSSIIINNVEIETRYYSMTIQNFINHAVRSIENGEQD